MIILGHDAILKFLLLVFAMTLGQTFLDSESSSDLFLIQIRQVKNTRRAAAQKTCSQKAMHAESARMRISSDMTSSL